MLTHEKADRQDIAGVGVSEPIIAMTVIDAQHNSAADSTLMKALRPPEDMPDIHLIDWPAGSGKTRAVIKDVIKAVKKGYKVVWTTPTVGVLQAETLARLIGDSVLDGLDEYLSEYDVHICNAQLREEEGYPDIGSMISQKVLDDIEQAPSEGRVFLCSWVGFLAAKQLRSATKFLNFPKSRLIIDEVPDVVEFSFYQSKDVNFGNYLSFSDDVVEPLADQVSHWELTTKGRSGNSVFDESTRLKALAELLVHPSYVTTKASYKKAAQMHLTSYLKPNIFSSFKEVEVLGANARDSLMCLLYSRWGVSFQINKKYNDDRKNTESLGDLFTIVPIQDEAVTKNSMTKTHKARWVMKRLLAIVEGFYGEAKPFIYCLNNGVKAGLMPVHAKETDTMLQGSNEYIEYEAAAFLTSLNPGREFLLDLEKRWGIDYGSYLRAKTAEVSYQYSYRIKARLGNRSLADRYLIVVLDRLNAAALSEKIEGSVVDQSYLQEDPEHHYNGNAGRGITGFLKVDQADNKFLRRCKSEIKVYREHKPAASLSEALSVLGGIKYKKLLSMANKYDVGVSEFEAVILGAKGSAIFPRPGLAALGYGFSIQ